MKRFLLTMQKKSIYKVIHWLDLNHNRTNNSEIFLSYQRSSSAYMFAGANFTLYFCKEIFPCFEGVPTFMNQTDPRPVSSNLSFSVETQRRTLVQAILSMPIEKIDPSNRWSIDRDSSPLGVLDLYLRHLRITYLWKFFIWRMSKQSGFEELVTLFVLVVSNILKLVHKPWRLASASFPPLYQPRYDSIIFPAPCTQQHSLLGDLTHFLFTPGAIWGVVYSISIPLSLASPSS